MGSNADVMLVDMDEEHVLRNEEITSKVGWTPFDGYRLKVQPVLTVLRGEVVAEPDSPPLLQ